MRLKMRRLSVSVALVVGAVVGVPVAGAQAVTPKSTPESCRWLHTDLAMPEGTDDGEVIGTDGGTRLVGQVGKLGDPYRDEAVIWENGVPRRLGQIDGKRTSAVAVNRSGIVVAANADHTYRLRGGAWEVLPALGIATSINSSGDIGGLGQTRGEIVVWRAAQPSNPRILTMPDGLEPYKAWLDDGGYVTASSSGNKAFVWAPDGTRTQLQPPDPSQPGGWVSVHDMKNGRIVGLGGISGSPSVAVEWDVTGRLVRIFPGALWADAVNSNTLMVGRYDDGGPREVYGVWDSDKFLGPVVIPATTDSIHPTVITDDNVIAGYWADPYGNRYQPTLWKCV